MNSVAHGIFTLLTWAGVVGMVFLVVWILSRPSRSRRGTSVDRARQLGREAAEKGAAFHNNPYVTGTEERLEWENARIRRMDELLRANLASTVRPGLPMDDINRELKK